MEKYNTDVTIIGAGPVGLFSVFACGMLDMKCCIIDSLPFIGGQCANLYSEKPIYDIPGYAMITAKQLVDNLNQQIAPFNGKFLLNNYVNTITKNENIWSIKTDKNNFVTSKVIIFATGAGNFVYNKPRIANIDQYDNKSVFYSINDVSLFKDKKVIIAGGGDSAVDWAIELAKNSDVSIIHRRDKFTCMPQSNNIIRNHISNNKIKFYPGYQLKKLHGNNGDLQAIDINNIEDNSIFKLDADYLLIFFGLVNNNDIIDKMQFVTNKYKKIIINPTSGESSINSIYAVGDCCYYDNKKQLILSGFAETTQAAYHCYSYVFAKQPRFIHSTNKGVSNN